MPHWRADRAEVMAFLSGGYSNENFQIGYEGEVYVLRVPTRARPFVDRGHELRAYRALAARSGEGRLRTPELVAFDAGSGLMLTRFEAGRLLSETEVPPAGLAGYLRDLHRALPVSGRRYDPLALQLPQSAGSRTWRHRWSGSLSTCSRAITTSTPGT